MGFSPRLGTVRRLSGPQQIRLRAGSATRVWTKWPAVKCTHFNLCLDTVSLLRDLQQSKFGIDSNQCPNKVSLPGDLRQLTFRIHISQDLDDASLSNGSGCRGRSGFPLHGPWMVS